MVYFENKLSKKEKPRRNYRNPICLAKEYKRMIEKGEVKSESDLAKKLGVSRVRVNQIIRLLKLDDGIIKALERLDDPLSSQIVTERMLRQYVGSKLKNQENILRIIFKKTSRERMYKTNGVRKNL